MPEDIYYVDNPMAIIGDEDVVIGFKALGLKCYPVKNADGCKETLDELMQNKAVICLIQDNFYPLLEDRIATYKTRPLSIFIPFSKTKKTTLLDDMIKKMRLRATGAL